MRIGIDARFYSEQGHGRYIRNLIAELAKIDNDDHYVVFLIAKDYDKFEIRNPRFEKRLADVRWYTLGEQTKLLKIFLNANLDLLHVPHFNVPILYPKPCVLTIHDLTITHYSTIRATTLPYPVWKTKRLAYKLVLSIALRRAKKIIAVSDFTKSEIRKFYPSIPKSKIVVTKEGVDQSFIKTSRAMSVDNPKVATVKKQYGISQQYLLYIGNVHPHKNIERLIRVFHQLRQDLSENIELVLVGKDDYFQKRLQMEIGKWQMENGVVWTGFVPDDDLIPLLKGAAAFVFPSLMDGFGIPPLEAMACGTPTIVSNAGSLPEVCGNASLYFDPTDETEMASQIKHLLEDAELRLTLIQNGYEQIKQYSWAKMAQETVAVYQTISK